MTSALGDNSGGFAANCSGCHGAVGEGNAEMDAPVLAGLDRVYLQRQVQHFLDGARPVAGDNAAAAGMLEVLRGLKPEEIDGAIAYVSGLMPPAMKTADAGLSYKVRNLVSECTSCHGGDMQGTPELSAPRLTSQHARYLKEQILAFRSGRRGAAPNDKYGKQMQAMALDIPSEDSVDVIVKYILASGR
jgi:cytochrome c oxidase subunit 2